MKKLLIDSKHGRFEVLVDDSDYERVKNINWFIHRGPKRRTQYAIRWVKNRENRSPINQPMHRFLLDPPKGMVVDHIDRNGLNNQRSNLRVCTNEKNILNRNVSIKNKSGYTGVHFCKRQKKWVAAITLNSKKKFLGYFKTIKEAHEAWQKKAKELRGEFHGG